MAGGQGNGIKAADFLNRASETLRDRAETHGAMQRNYRNVALLWSAFLQTLGHPITLKASEAAELMALLKNARRRDGSYNDDDDVDALGYDAIVAELRATEEAARLDSSEARVVAQERAKRKPKARAR
jgi:hypothetical protein